MTTMSSARHGKRMKLQWQFLLLISVTIIKLCTCDETCENRKPPTVFLNGIATTVEETNFPRHYRKYPPDASYKSGEPSYYILQHDKHVLYVPNFVNQTMSDEIKSLCVDSSRFVRSPIRGVGDGSSVEKNQLRTSESCAMVPAAMYLSNQRYLSMIREEPQNPQIVKIAREVDISWDIAVRASDILELDAATVESLQVVRYTHPAAEYKLHHDHGGYYGKDTEHRPWTMLIFLNDVSSGGYTSFPELNLQVVPRGGDAIIWSNVQGGEVDHDMVHMGMPPSEEGIEKYAVNVWFGESSLEERQAKETGQWS